MATPPFTSAKSEADDQFQIKAGGPAFPLNRHSHGWDTGACGMTLRDWFAGMAMQSIYRNTPRPIDGVAEIAYKVADAMLAERKKEKL